MNSNLKSLAFNGEDFAFNPMTGQSFSINETGEFLVKELIAGGNSEQLQQKLQDKYSITEQEAFLDVEEFLIKLKLYDLGV